MKIIIWGTGNAAKKFIEKIDFKKNEIVAFIDNNKSKIGSRYINDTIIISPEEIGLYQYDLIIICSVYYMEIMAQCDKLGIVNAIPYNEEDVLVAYRDLFTDEILRDIHIRNTRIIKKTYDLTQEMMWSHVFKDTVKGLEWYDVKSLSPGRWAVGYNYMYVLVRTLEAIRPKAILELGLGQSTKIMASYFRNLNDGEYYDVVEQDKEWAEFFSNGEKIDSIEGMTIHTRPIYTKEYNGADVYVYEDFDSVVKNKKYSLISIDGPWGSDLYSRMDILNYIPSILNDSFAILVDDYNRYGEKAMIKDLMKILKNNGIEYDMGMYSGEKDMLIIMSKNYKYLTSL